MKSIRIVAEGDIQKLLKLYKKHKLNFWSRVFEEYGRIYIILELDSRKNDLFKDNKRRRMDEGLENGRLFGSLNNKRIK